MKRVDIPQSPELALLELAFDTYLRNLGIINGPGSLSDELLERLNNEFVAKVQWVQHYAKIKLEQSITFEIAAQTAANLTTFNAAVCGKMFDGFMHFISVNETRPEVLNSLMVKWVLEGRSLTELDALGTSPLSVSVNRGNINAVVALAQHDVDVTAVDERGFTELHKIVDYVEQGKLPLSTLSRWVESGLPTNVTSTNPSPKYSGKTAARVAVEKGMVEATIVLGGDIEEARGFRSERIKVSKVLVLQSYEHHIESLGGVGVGNKLLLNYLARNCENADLTPEVFEAILVDEELGAGLDPNVVVGQERTTALEILIKDGVNSLKANMFALKMAEHGIGTVKHCAGMTAYSIAAKYGNIALLEQLADRDLPCPENPGVIHQCCKSEILDSPFVVALLTDQVETAVFLVKNKLAHCIIKVGAKGKALSPVEAVRLLGGDNKLALLEKIAPYINMKAEEVAQELLHSILNGQNDFAEKLIELGANINHNNGEMLKLFVTNGLVGQSRFCIEHGAVVTEEIRLESQRVGIDKQIAVFDYSPKHMTTKQKIQKVLEKFVAKLSAIEISQFIASSARDAEEAQKLSHIHQTVQTMSEPGLKMLCKVYKVAIPPITPQITPVVAPLGSTLLPFNEENKEERDLVGEEYKVEDDSH